MSTSSRKLRVFLCHASQDKPIVRELYRRLLAEGWIDPWLDEEKLLPGQDWTIGTEKAVETTDAMVVCISNASVTKEGYVHREIRFGLSLAQEMPEGKIYILPARIEDASVPNSLSGLQWVNLYEDNGYSLLIRGLKHIANVLGIPHPQAQIIIPKRRLKVFLCHESSESKFAREFYYRLNSENWIDPWFDEENLLPSQRWDLEIEKAIINSDVVLVFLSEMSVNKAGYYQKELRLVSETSLEKPEETIFVVPIRLDDVKIPRRFDSMMHVDYFPEPSKKNSYLKVLESLKMRARNLGIESSNINTSILSEIRNTISSQMNEIGDTPITIGVSGNIFISYSRNDVEFVKTLAADLKSIGFNVWWDISKLQGGDNWVRSINSALEKSHYCIVVATPDSMKSLWVEREYTYAFNRNLKVIPILLKSCDLPFAFSTIQYLDFREEKYKTSIYDLYSALNVFIAKK